MTENSFQKQVQDLSERVFHAKQEIRYIMKTLKDPEVEGMYKLGIITLFPFIVLAAATTGAIFKSNKLDTERAIQNADRGFQEVARELLGTIEQINTKLGDFNTVAVQNGDYTSAVVGALKDCRERIVRVRASQNLSA